MWKRIIPLVIFGIVAIAIVFFVNDTARMGEGPLYVRQYSTWDELGKDMVERCVIKFKDGDTYMLTQNDVNRISFPLSFFTEQKKKKISDIIYVVHNHLDLSRFSEQDKAFYNLLKSRGFHGFFLLKLVNGTILDYDEWIAGGKK